MRHNILLEWGISPGIWKRTRCFWSEGMYRLLSYDSDEELDYERVNTEIHHPEDLPRITEWLQSCIASGKEKHEPNEYRLRRRDGSIFWGQVRVLVKYHDGKPVKLIGTCLDIDALKKAEELVRRERNTLPQFL